MVHRIDTFIERALLGVAARTLGRHHRNALGATISCARSNLALRLLPLVYRAQLGWSRGDARAADLLWKRLEDANPDSSIWPLARANAARLSGDTGAQGKILASAHARGVSDPVIDAWINQAPSAGNRQHETRALINSDATPPASLFQASIQLSSDGHISDSRRALTRLLSDRRLGWEARVQLAALDLAETFGTARTLPGWLSPKRSSVLTRTESNLLLVVFLQPGG
ncbi:MAG: hypothetical protein ACK4NZ_13200, partial [Tsuneonella sp.]